MSTYNSYPENPDYGSGCFRRRIRLRASQHQVIAELEDHNHSFRLILDHDGTSVTAINADTLRIPFSTCPGAIAPLQALTGLPITEDSQALLARSNPSANCTHLYDLSLLAIAQAARGAGERIYDIRIDDEDGENSSIAEIFVNGERVHRWRCREWTILEPAAAFSGEAQRAAFALQKGYFVSSARRYDLNAMAGEAANDSREFMYGACYTYTSPQIEQATRVADSVRDFSDAEHQLLQFQEVTP